jgi:Tol biopolymer transport system component
MLPLLRLLVFASLSLASLEGQDSYDDYQKALRAERIEGDLERAIGLYERIVLQAKDETLAARAQLRIGMCYEKMGLKEAQDAYQKVIQAFPKQQQEVEVARERLEALAKAAEVTSMIPRFTPIRIPGDLEYFSGPKLSPDGLQLAFCSGGAIWQIPVHGQVDHRIAGKAVRLTDHVGAWGYGLSWSGDGRWIAFGAVGEKLYLVSTENGGISEIPVQRRLSGDPVGYRISLSPDGSVLAYSSVKERKSHIYVVPVAGGRPIQLTESWTREPTFSPDGTKIAYVKLSGYPWSDETIGEVRVVPISGGATVQVSQETGKVRSPIWSTDGSKITFLRELERGMEIKFVSVSPAGEPLGPARTLTLPRSSHHSLAGWTPEDSIGIPITNPEYQAIYTVPTMGGRALQVSPRGQVFHPRWSPDGERIYFRWRGGEIAFVPAEGGEVTIVEKAARDRVVEVTAGGGNAVSPDGQWIVFAAYQTGVTPVREHIWIMRIDGVELHQLTRGPGGDRFPCWAPDSETIAFLRGKKVERSVSFNIWTVSVKGGEPEQLSQTSDQVGRSQISWSPDGDQIAYFSKDSTLKVISISTVTSMEVARISGMGGHNELAWAPDSQEIAYTSKGRIWRVSLSDGLPREIESGIDGSASNIDWSPDGETLVFTASTGGRTVLVMMEDFLPALENR